MAVESGLWVEPSVCRAQSDAEEDQVCSRTRSIDISSQYPTNQTGRKFQRTDFTISFFNALVPEIPGSHDDREERHYSENNGQVRLFSRGING